MKPRAAAVPSLPPVPISAYVPCYNNAATLPRVIAAIRRQTCPVQQLLVIDDGSDDDSAAVAAALGAQVVSHRRNLGRGAARATAMLAARHELVLCCDGTKVLEPGFLAAALPCLADPKVAAVVGSLIQQAPGTAVERWRGRHLFKHCRAGEDAPRRQFASWAAVVRRSAALAVGNYDRRRRDNEDGDLGRRLLASGFQLRSAGAALVVEIGTNSVGQVLERHWRWGCWNRGRGEDLSWRTYGRWVLDSFRRMAVADLRSGDLAGAAISLCSPHYRFWRSQWGRQLTRHARRSVVA